MRIPMFRHPLQTFAGYFSRRQFFEPGGYLEIWRIAWPLIILSASNTVMMLTNRIFLAHDSPEEIAAAMPAGQMFFTLMAFFLITTSFSATVIAQFHGANDRVGCVQAAWNGFYFGTIVAIVLTFTLPAGGAWIIAHNGHHSAIAAYETEYFTAMSPGQPLHAHPFRLGLSHGTAVGIRNPPSPPPGMAFFPQTANFRGSRRSADLHPQCRVRHRRDDDRQPRERSADRHQHRPDHQHARQYADDRTHGCDQHHHRPVYRETTPSRGGCSPAGCSPPPASTSSRRTC